MDVKFPTWQLPYLDAVSEVSEGSLRERVDVAERAILIRLEVLSRTSGRETERLAIREALDALHVIKRERLDFPHWGQASAKFQILEGPMHAHRACFQKVAYLSGFSGNALASLMTSNVVLTTALCLSMASTEQYFSSEIRMASLTAAASMS